MDKPLIRESFFKFAIGDFCRYRILMQDFKEKGYIIWTENYGRTAHLPLKRLLKIYVIFA